MRIGGDEENRTPDPLLARQVLSQLSYTPKFLLILRQALLDILMYCLRPLSLSEQEFLLIQCIIFWFTLFCLGGAFKHPTTQNASDLCRLPSDCSLSSFAARALPSTVSSQTQLRNVNAFLWKAFVVGLSGLEPPTSRLSGVRSNRLSYRPAGF